LVIQEKEKLNNCQDRIKPMNSLKFSVVICGHTIKRLETIMEAISSVLAQTAPPYEVIISVDHNEELYNKLITVVPEQVMVILNQGIRGLSETRNMGIRKASGDIIAFMDDDAVAQKDWLENYALAFDNSHVMAVGGESIPVWPKGKQPLWFPEEFDWTIGCTAHNKLMLQPNGEIRNVTGSNMAFRNEAFKKVGFWDTELGALDGKSRGGEEANICLRIKAGIDDSLITYAPKAIVLHKVIRGRDTVGHLLSYCWDEGFNRAKMRQLTASYVKNPLATESVFMRRLIAAIFGRLARFYKASSVPQIGAIWGCLTCMAITYVIGRVEYR
jgi:glucosyl-dolichyl phosphate glucuronosyltransferase